MCISWGTTKSPEPLRPIAARFAEPPVETLGFLPPPAYGPEVFLKHGTVIGGDDNCWVYRVVR